MRAVLVKYNPNTDATVVRIDSGFQELPILQQLDCLRDAMYDIGQVYDAKLDELHDSAKPETEQKGEEP